MAADDAPTKSYVESSGDQGRFTALRLALASPETIRGWSSGEVTSDETINYRTLKPEHGGLFCERIFGPSRDWECHCGKYKGRRHAGVACERCGVEVTRSEVRRERMGHIELAGPVAHSWYARGPSSRVALLLDIAPRALERVIYFAAYLVTEVDQEAQFARIGQLYCALEDALGGLEDERPEAGAGRRWRAGEYARRRLAIVRDYEGRIAALEALCPRQVLDEAGYDRLMHTTGGAAIFAVGMGAEAVYDIVGRLDLAEEARRVGDSLGSQTGPARRRAERRLRTIEAFRRGGTDPRSMFFTALPVLPPELRPLVAMAGGRFATSDLNELYRRVIARNGRLKRLLAIPHAPEIIIRNEARMLQEAVDALIDNGRHGNAVTGPRGKGRLKSLGDLLGGKRGRLRQNLLGKRVDFSGRSVISIGADLELGQCGLPRRMALEIFKPFVMARLIKGGQTRSMKGAKRLVERVDPRVWPALEEVTRDRLVLLNRAPTLHQLSVQAFEVKLVEGNVIRLHPLVCRAFNADFDGDQMAVHLPLAPAAQAEARGRMWSRTNLLSPANGEPTITPQQDIVLGCHYLTLPRAGARGEGKTFASVDEVRLAYDSGVVDLQATIRVPMANPHAGGPVRQLVPNPLAGGAVGRPAEASRVSAPGGCPGATLVETTPGRVLFNEELPPALRYRNATIGAKDLARLLADCYRLLGPEACARLADRLKALGFRYSTRAAISVGLADMTIPPEKAVILAEGRAEEEQVRRDCARGILSEEERRRETIRIWSGARDRVAAAVKAGLDPHNSLYLMAASGARGNFNQINQMAGMRGLLLDASGRTIEVPILSNYREGISVLQYFLATSGARKGATDRSLRTADAGYLTRRLVDVAQDVVVTIDDCGTAAGLAVPVPPRSVADGRDQEDTPEAPDALVAARLCGRHTAAAMRDPGATGGEPGETIVERGAELTEERVAALLDLPVRPVSVPIRTALACEAPRGICRLCYGRHLATGRTVELGTAVGVIAAQSIGEPGTQLTMKTFQLGGVASAANITSGLLRVEELFEARPPRGKALLAGIGGRVTIAVRGAARTLRLVNDGGCGAGESVVSGDRAYEREYALPVGARLFVADGDVVARGTQLTDGPLDPHKLLALRGRAAVQEYLLAEVQGVYRSQGVAIADQHVEVIVRQMLRAVTVDEPGDSGLLPGQLVARHTFAKVNAATLARPGAPATARETLLGITKASLSTESFLSAASFQETARILTDAAIRGQVDALRGLKENVIIGRLIPAGTGFGDARRATR